MILRIFVFFVLFHLGYFEIDGQPLEYFSKKVIGCPVETNSPDIANKERLFFLVPTAESNNPSLELWFADKSGSHRTPLTSFMVEDTLLINPAGDSILAMRIKDKSVPIPKGSFDFRGGYLEEMLVIDTTDFSSTPIRLPKETSIVRFQQQIHWIANNKAILISAPQDQKILELNTETGDVIIENWPAFPDMSMEFPGGYLLPSPNGEYFLYTAAHPLIGFPYELAWKIANRQGEIVLDYVVEDYIVGVGNTAVWLPDSSGIIVRSVNYSQGTDHPEFSLSLVTLDGQQTQLDINSQPLKQGTFDREGTRIAYVDTENLLTGEYRLKILDVKNQAMKDYCGLYIAELGAWSHDNQAIAYRTSALDILDIYILNVNEETLTPVLPYQPIDDFVGGTYIRIVGWGVLST